MFITFIFFNDSTYCQIRFFSVSNEKYIKKIFSEMTGGEEIPKVSYKSLTGYTENDYADRQKTKEAYLELLSSSYEREIGAGATLYGVHKDDVEIILNERDARSFASQGQQRSLSLALKLAEGELCREDCGEYPVFLLDDVLSELDGARREYLLHRIKGKQVIMTTCEPTLDHADHLVYVEGGTFRENF